MATFQQVLEDNVQVASENLLQFITLCHKLGVPRELVMELMALCEVHAIAIFYNEIGEGNIRTIAATSPVVNSFLQAVEEDTQDDLRPMSQEG